MKFVFDIETDGFIKNMTLIHCFVLIDIESKKIHRFRDNLKEGIKILEKADLLIGHNILSFDIPAIKKLYNFNPKGETFDTLLEARKLWPKIIEEDNRKDLIPTEFRGRHLLKAWGYRLGEYKGDYEGPWNKYYEEMMLYCEQDVHVTFKLWKYIMSNI